MSDTSEIICRPTKWFIWRALLMLAMFGGFALYFLYDWKIGYPKKNYMVSNYQAFSDAGKAWTEEENRNDWEAYVAKQKIPFSEEEGVYPPDTDLEEKWPEVLKTMSGNGNDEELWKEYSGERGWTQKIDPDEDFFSAKKIRHQLIAAGVCFLLTAVTLFYLFRTKGRFMKVDEKGFYPPAGSLIPFGEMITLDKRKWETKGLATVTYKDGEEEKKAKIDGMVYGQFKEEEGAPAEALFQKVLENFEGELIELVIEDEDEEDEESDSQEEIVEGDSGEEDKQD